MTSMIDLDDTHLDMLVEFNHIEGMGNATISHLGDMNQSILMDTDIHKGTKVGDVSDDARQDHTFHKIVDGGDILVELELLQLLPRVTPWLLQFLHDIGEGGDTYLGCDISFDVDGLALLFVFDQVCDTTALVLGHLFDDSVTLGMDGRVVEWVLGAWDA